MVGLGAGVLAPRQRVVSDAGSDMVPRSAAGRARCRRCRRTCSSSATTCGPGSRRLLALLGPPVREGVATSKTSTARGGTMPPATRITRNPRGGRGSRRTRDAVPWRHRQRVVTVVFRRRRSTGRTVALDPVRRRGGGSCPRRGSRRPARHPQAAPSSSTGQVPTPTWTVAGSFGAGRRARARRGRRGRALVLTATGPTVRGSRAGRWTSPSPVIGRPYGSEPPGLIAEQLRPATSATAAAAPSRHHPARRVGQRCWWACSSSSARIRARASVGEAGARAAGAGLSHGGSPWSGRRAGRGPGRVGTGRCRRVRRARRAAPAPGLRPAQVTSAEHLALTVLGSASTCVSTARIRASEPSRSVTCSEWSGSAAGAGRRSSPP